MVGVDAIASVLSQLPKGESVYWCDELHIGQVTVTDIDFQLPPEQMISAIKEQAQRCGLDFEITLR